MATSESPFVFSISATRNLIKLVRERREIYDFNCPGFHDHELDEEHWLEISSILQINGKYNYIQYIIIVIYVLKLNYCNSKISNHLNNWTMQLNSFFLVLDCKQKWRSLRNSFSRHKRRQMKCGSASYYLAKELKFLTPFLNTKQPRFVLP